MIIKSANTEFIFRFCCNSLPPPNKIITIHTLSHKIAGFFFQDDLIALLSISIFISGSHWWHHRGYHKRHHRSCYKDVWNRNTSMTWYNQDVYSSHGIMTWWTKTSWKCIMFYDIERLVQHAEMFYLKSMTKVVA